MNFRKLTVYLSATLFILVSSNLWAGDQEHTTSKKAPAAPKMNGKMRSYSALNSKDEKIKYNITNYSFHTIDKKVFDLPKGKIIIVMQGSKTCPRCTYAVQAIEGVKKAAFPSSFQFYVHSSWDTPRVMSNKYKKFKGIDGYIQNPKDYFGYAVYEQFNEQTGIPKIVIYGTNGDTIETIYGFDPDHFREKVLRVLREHEEKEIELPPSMQAPF